MGRTYNRRDFLKLGSGVLGALVIGGSCEVRPEAEHSTIFEYPSVSGATSLNIDTAYSSLWDAYALNTLRMSDAGSLIATNFESYSLYLSQLFDISKEQGINTRDADFYSMAPFDLDIIKENCRIVVSKALQRDLLVVPALNASVRSWDEGGQKNLTSLMQGFEISILKKPEIESLYQNVDNPYFGNFLCKNVVTSYGEIASWYQMSLTFFKSGYDANEYNYRSIRNAVNYIENAMIDPIVYSVPLEQDPSFNTSFYPQNS